MCNGKPDCKCQRQSLSLNFSTTQKRYETLRGEKYLIVPVVMLREDAVMNGALVPKEEYFPAAWNGVPVTVGHPQGSDGEWLSANTPETREDWSIGWIFNAYVDDGSLRGEAWLNVKVARSKFPDVLDMILTDEPLNISTGYFCRAVNATGSINGQSYTEIARDLRPDHLALLPGEVGACSWEAGCGVRNNRRMEMTANETLTAIRKALGMSVDDTASSAPVVTNATQPLTAEQVATIVTNALAAHRPPLDPAVAEIVNTYQAELKARKSGLVERVVANTTIPKEKAEAMDVSTLQTIIDGLPEPAVSFGGRALPRANSDQDQIDMSPPDIVTTIRNAKK